ncbi:MAG: hypothetical protein H7837_01625 [Magnetococcus sp. MYC-9]
MSTAEEIYQRARSLPVNRAEEVLDFIGYIESVLERQHGADRHQATVTDQSPTHSRVAIPVIEDEAPSDHWPEPIYAGAWNHSSDHGLNPTMPWNPQAFLDRCAGSIPDFPDIEDEGPLQERERME